MVTGKRVICQSTDLVEAGAGIRFEVRQSRRQLPAFVVRHEGVVRAYLNQCRHVPVELDWQPGVFFDLSGSYLVCAVHGAFYSPQSGLCLGGPCKGRSLMPLRVIEWDGCVYLDEQEAD